MLISIIIPTYNRAKFLPRAIESVINQTFKDWELIIVDDGSTDKTSNVVKQYQDNRIRYIYQENSERSAARNNGIKHAKGKYICFLDSDDYYLSSHLEKLNNFIAETSEPKVMIITNSYIESNNVRKKQLLNYPGQPLPFLFKNFVTPNMVCIHRDIVQEFKFIEKYKFAYWEDTHFWVRIAIYYPVLYNNNFTCVQVEHEQRSINKIEKHKLKKRFFDHISMVQDLFLSYGDQLNNLLGDNFFRNYMDNRFRMFLYMARINRYVLLSLKIWWKALLNKFSFYLILELPRIIFNYLKLKTN